MKQVHSIFLAALCCILGFSACNRTDNPQPTVDVINGYFVVCEGTFGHNNGEITFIDSVGHVTNEVFKTVNGRTLGDIVQSLTIVDSLAFIVVNNSQKIEVIHAKTFQSVKTLDDARFTYPRYVQKLDDNRILVTNGHGMQMNDDFVYVVNSHTFEITNAIPTGAGPNQMVQQNGRIFVANFGGWTNDSTITVINANTLAIEQTVKVGDMPSSMEIDSDGNIIIFCKGLSTYDPTTWEATVVSNSKIVKVNTSTLAAQTLYTYNRQIQNQSANVIAYANKTLYVSDDDGVYTFDATFSAPQKLLSTANAFYGINIIGSTLWLCVGDPANSQAIQYTLQGTKVKSFNTDPFPNAVIVSAETK
ncbi:MAG: hypothetical protein LBU90_06500 [Bacteroidales bacterium]|jgi:YVTN family beta-propeller protein|nr:hypothetical protein [Bacteroidales bacterium]